MLSISIITMTMRLYARFARMALNSNQIHSIIGSRIVCGNLVEEMSRYHLNTIVSKLLSGIHANPLPRFYLISSE
jgi:hypothetical protein